MTQLMMAVVVASLLEWDLQNLRLFDFYWAECTTEGYAITNSCSRCKIHIFGSTLQLCFVE